MDDNFPGACGKAVAPLSDRERKLLEAERDARATLGDITLCSFPNLDAAIRAYDPPRKRYTMPTWEEFTYIAGPQGAKLMHIVPYIQKEQYQAIREALATEEQ